MRLEDFGLNVHLKNLCNNSTEDNSSSSENCALSEDIVESVTNILDDNTYRYSYNFAGEGVIRIDSSLLTQNKVFCEFYNNTNFEGDAIPNLCDNINVDLTETESIFNYTYNDFVVSLINNYSTRYNATLNSPVSGSYSFTLGCDDS